MMFLSILNDAGNIASYVLDGVKQVFDFLLNIPQFINSLIGIIPSPFKEILLGFSGIIIVYFIAKAVMSIVN